MGANMFVLTTFFLAILLGGSTEDVIEQNSLTVAIIQYNGEISNSNLNKFILTNYEIYNKFITTASNNGADIIVFPKATQSDTNTNRANLLQDAFEIPYSDDVLKDNSVLFKLAREIKKRQIYVLLNVIEKLCNKTKCSPREINLHNANVILDKNGKIISRRISDNVMNMNESSSLTENERIFDKISYYFLKSTEDLKTLLLQKSFFRATEIVSTDYTSDGMSMDLILYKLDAKHFNNYLQKMKYIHEEVENTILDLVKYVWNKLQILTLIIVIYFLEMM